MPQGKYAYQAGGSHKMTKMSKSRKLGNDYKKNGKMSYGKKSDKMSYKKDDKA